MILFILVKNKKGSEMMLEDLHTTIVAIEKKLTEMGDSL
jgi:hypothetical protein